MRFRRLRSSDVVIAWVCPKCDRQFGRNNQGHECSPAMTLDEYFASSNERERPIFEVVRDHLDGLGEYHTEAVSVGIFFKNGPRFAELRSRKKWVAVCFLLPMKLPSNRLSRKVISSGGSGGGGRYYHVINISDPAEIDDQIREWLTDAYVATDM